jgi:CheY-like chemotaxis protein
MRHPGDMAVDGMETKLDNPWFLRQVRTALNSLYDPLVLRNSPLVSLLGLEQRRDVVAALRRALTDAIESLQPTANTPRDSKTWRVYQILRRRYIEQLNQREVAFDLGLSTRQLQREEHLARQVLADHLWAAHHLDAKQHLIPVMTDQEKVPLEDEYIPTRAQELEWLKESMPVQTVEVGDVLRDVLGVLDPLLKSSRVTVEYLPQANVPRVSLQVPILRQALLDVISEAVRCAPGGEVRIMTEALVQGVSVQVQACGAAAGAQSAESLEMTGQLVQLCGGTLEIGTAATGEGILAKMTLPATEQVTVLVIDDNGDALQLLQRYLSNSRYRFIGTQDAEHGLALAEDMSPHIIVLDVMMPERDGWTVLGQLREHPKTHNIPVIICSILAQEQLALTLGAAQFLRKPITRQALLSALDHQLDLAAQKPC